MADSKRIDRSKLRPGVWLKRKNNPDASKTNGVHFEVSS